MRQLGIVILLFGLTAQSVSIFGAGEGGVHKIIVQKSSDMNCTANVGVVTPYCSGGRNPSCMVSLHPAIFGVKINNGILGVLKSTGEKRESIKKDPEGWTNGLVNGRKQMIHKKNFEDFGASISRFVLLTGRFGEKHVRVNNCYSIT